MALPMLSMAQAAHNGHPRRAVGFSHAALLYAGMT